MSSEQGNDEAGFAVGRQSLWLLCGPWTESRESAIKEPSAFKIQGREEDV